MQHDYFLIFQVHLSENKSVLKPAILDLFIYFFIFVTWRQQKQLVNT